MGISNYDPYARYRNRASQRFMRFLSFVAIAVVFSATGFVIGRQTAMENAVATKSQLESMTQQRNALQDGMTKLRAESQTASLRFQQLQDQLNKEIPDGPMRELVNLVRKQIADGIDPLRLGYLIRSARPPANCTDPETKRFVVTTPAYKGQDSNISLADGGVVITGSGVSARNPKGEPEAWFDPAQPVTLEFAPRGADKQVKKGVLPLSHSVVLGDREYRLTFSEGSRSFIKATYDSCSYP